MLYFRYLGKQNFVGRYIIALFLMLTHFTILCQEIKWPPKEWRDSVHCEQRHPGYVCLPSCNGDLTFKSGDTIKNCYITIRGNNCDVLPYQNFEPQTISNFEISCINADVPQFDNEHTELR